MRFDTLYNGIPIPIQHLEILYFYPCSMEGCDNEDYSIIRRNSEGFRCRIHRLEPRRVRRACGCNRCAG